MPAPEVLTILGRRTGKLLLDLPNRDPYELHLHEATLWSLYVGGVPQTEVSMVLQHLSVLNRAREGRFEFVNTSSAALDHQLDLSRQELLARDAGGDDGGDEALATTAMPDKGTRFRLKPGSSEHVPENLQSFLASAQTFLTQGSSAEEVAQALGMSVLRTQIYFQRLRVLGHLTPVRAFQAELEQFAGQILPAAPPLRPASNRQVLARDAYTNATPDKPARSLVRRLLSVLTLGAIR